MRAYLIAVGVWIALAGYVAGQTLSTREEIRLSWIPYFPVPSQTFVVDSRLIEVPTVVRDAAGREVGGLTKADFELYDAGQKREISSFSVVTATSSQRSPVSQEATDPVKVARYVALVIDDVQIKPAPCSSAPGTRSLMRSASPQSELPGELLAKLAASVAEIKASVQRYLNTASEPDTVISLFGLWSGQVAAFTSDHAVLRSALDRITIHTKCGDPAEKIADLYDIVSYLARMPGSRTVFLASRSIGGDHFELSELANQAIRAGIVINTLDATGLEPRPDAASLEAADTLNFFAAATGGQFFHNNNDFAGGVGKLISAPEITYLLGFSPEQAPDGRYHSLRVKLNQPRHDSVQARPSYFAEQPKRSGKPRPDDLMSQAVLADVSRSEIPVTFSEKPGPATGNGAAIAATMQMDVGRLSFMKQGDRRTQKITLVAALFDLQGNYLSGRKGSVELSLTDATFATLSKQGMPLTLVLEAPPGRYRLRMVAREDSTRRMSATSESVELRP